MKGLKKNIIFKICRNSNLMQQILSWEDAMSLNDSQEKLNLYRNNDVDVE